MSKKVVWYLGSLVVAGSLLVGCDEGVGGGEEIEVEEGVVEEGVTEGVGEEGGVVREGAVEED